MISNMKYSYCCKGNMCFSKYFKIKEKSCVTKSIPHIGLGLGLEGCGLGLGLVLSGLVNIPDIDGGNNACSIHHPKVPGYRVG